MPKERFTHQFNQSLHISYSQIFTYTSCSLKYKFQYVQARPQERISIALPFGAAIHKSVEAYYSSFKEKNTSEPLPILQELFVDSITAAFDGDVPIIFKKETPDKESTIELGKNMLQAFHETVDLTGMEIVDTELPLSARLYTGDGNVTDFEVKGVIDLLLRAENGNFIIVDTKTAARSKSQSSVDEDLQLTVYSYLLAANKYIFPTAPVQCRFDILRKLKKPKLEQVTTIRTSEHRKRLARIATAVLKGVENKVFFPQKSWLCADCPFLEACSKW